MQTNTHDLSAETLFKASDLSRQQADIQTLRLQGYTQQEIADILDMELGSIKSQCSRIDNEKTVRLPEVSKIETHARVGSDDDRAVVIWFANDAKLQYRVNDHGEVYEETAAADDPHSIVEAWQIPVEPEELEEAALESLAEYTNTYRDDFDAIRRDWPHVFEALTLIEA